QVYISTAAGTDKFKWRKNAGAYSAEISATGSSQTLSDGLSILLASTGHALNDTWYIFTTNRSYLIRAVADPTTNPVAALAGVGSGNATNGNHGFVVGFVTPEGETFQTALGSTTAEVTDNAT